MSELDPLTSTFPSFFLSLSLSLSVRIRRRRTLLAPDRQHGTMDLRTSASTASYGRTPRGPSAATRAEGREPRDLSSRSIEL